MRVTIRRVFQMKTHLLQEMTKTGAHALKEIRKSKRLFKLEIKHYQKREFNYH